MVEAPPGGKGSVRVGTETGIAWTDHTFNIAWGCTKVSPGCAHCYAEDLSTRYGHGVWGPNKPRRTFGPKHWGEPIAWNRAAAKACPERRRVFCSSMCDIFEDHPTIAEELLKLWPLIRETPWLDWQLLTKRAERIVECLPADWGGGYPNVWLGVSIETREYEWRVQALREAAARIRFVSYEPALGPLAGIDLSGVDWLIYGGESGAEFRRDEEQWARDIREQCRREGVAFFFKQRAARYPGTGTMPLLSHVLSGEGGEGTDGDKPREFPLSVICEPVLSKGQG
jgi:protein gp37